MSQEVPPWWPTDKEPRDPEDREDSNRFSVSGVQEAEAKVREELDRIDARHVRIDREAGRTSAVSFPGVVVRWKRAGKPHVLPCDTFDTRGHNLRAASLTIKNLRLIREDYDCMTLDEAYKGLEALPGTAGGNGAPLAGDPSPYEVLGVSPDEVDHKADVEDAFRDVLPEVHPDRGGSDEAFKRAQEARDELLERVP